MKDRRGPIDFARCSLHNRCINIDREQLSAKETGVKTGEKLNLRMSLIYLADREGFEPSVQVLARTTV